MDFSDTDKPIILDKAAKEVEQHNGAVWTHIVSLKREDAERMGYNTLDNNALYEQGKMLVEGKAVLQNIKKDQL